MEEYQEYKELVKVLYKEIPILTAQIRAVYRELDNKFHLRGAQVPITFGVEKELLGSYTRGEQGEKEHFHFSLLFVGYAVKHPLSKEDRMDLYKHEYAHYMQHQIVIPEEYRWQAGTHGSAWKYCCSLTGAVPTPSYRTGEALRKQDYDKVLKNRIHDRTVPIRDRYRQEQEYREKKNSIIQYQVGDQVVHPKFGTGDIEEIEPKNGGVNLHIRFKEGLKKIDQKRLLQTKYQKAGKPN